MNENIETIEEVNVEPTEQTAENTDPAAIIEAATTETPEEAPERILNHDIDQIEQAIESMIFAAPQTLSLQKIKKILDKLDYATDSTNDIIQSIEQRFEKRGIQLKRVGKSFQFRTNPACAEVVKSIVEDKPARLGKSALEVLAIVAYKQPVTRSDVDSVRGTDCGHLFRGLLEKNLVRTAGHKDSPGRPLLYTTTPYFLETFDLNSLDELPALEEFQRELEDLDAIEGLEEGVNVLAADPDRGEFDEPAEDEVIHPDFSSDDPDEAVLVDDTESENTAPVEA